MAYAALIFLKHNIERLINPTLDRELTKELRVFRRFFGIGRWHGTITSKITKELNYSEKILTRLDSTRNRSINRSVINALDAEIREAVWKLEDVLEYYVLYQSSPSPPHDHPQMLPVGKINDVKNEICSFLSTVQKLSGKYASELCSQFPTEEDDAVLPMDDFGGKKSTMTVGLFDQIEIIINELVDPYNGNKTVALVGMAGIGKTHLAREVYQHPIILQHFDLLVWVRVGPQQQLENVWADIVAEVERKPKNLYLETSIVTLVRLLRKGLRGRRYLIVLDDVWSARLCYCLIWLVRADRNGSSLLLTTRLQEVAKDVGTTTHQMRFLNNEESWDLLWQNVFASFPCQLEKAGKKIAEKCEGLPLLILAVADILGGLDKTEEYWNKVAGGKTATFTDAYDKIYKVLFLSYEYLQQHLKPCFLYMGVFPQSCEIPLSKLIDLWAIEDFLEPEPFLTRVVRTPKKAHVKPTQRTSKKFGISNSSSTCRAMRAFETLYLLEPGPSPTRFITPFEKIDSFEQEPSLPRAKRKIDSSPDLETFDVITISENFAMECVEKLVSNSLAIICKNSSSNRIKSCKLHSAYWYLCVKEARKSKFFHVLNKLSDGSRDYIESQRRLSVQNNILFGIKEVHDSMASALTTRSLLCTGKDDEYPVPICLNLMLLKLLDALSIRLYEFPTEVLKLVRLRYLALTHNGKVPSSISKLKQLQFMIVRQHHNIKLLRDPPRLPKEIWDMQELTHLRIMGSNLPDPSSGALVSKLLTLHVNAHSCTKGVFKSIPHLKKLGIKIELQPDAAETINCFEHIRLLDELESVKCVVLNPQLRSQVVAPPNHLSNFPRGLKKLSLNGLGYSWKYITAIGSLRQLQVLKLRCSAFQGAKWETNAGEFQSLEFLLLEDIDVVQWTTDDDDSFPRLRRLIIRHCYKLKEIPQRIEAIPTLETMEVVDCSSSFVASLKKIEEDEYSSLHVVINSSWKL